MSPLEKLWNVVSSLATQNELVTNAMIYKALGEPPQRERDLIRKRLNGLVKRGSLNRVKPGCFTIATGHLRQTSPLVTKIWRALKTTGASFDLDEIARMSGASIKYVSKYIQHLEGEGFVARAGLRGKAPLYRVAQKVRNEQEAPLPPRPIKDSFEVERAAVCRLVKLMMLSDLYSPRSRTQIVAECSIIAARFNKKEAPDAQ